MDELFKHYPFKERFPQELRDRYAAQTKRNPGIQIRVFEFDQEAQPGQAPIGYLVAEPVGRVKRVVHVTRMKDVNVSYAKAYKTMLDQLEAFNDALERMDPIERARVLCSE